MMKANALEFRLRMIAMTAIMALGFWSPWIETLHIGTRTTAWLWLGFELGGLGISTSVAIRLVTIGVIAVAAAAALLRVWGAAYLGTATVVHARMLGQRVLADGPFRYVRNPLYLGTWLMCAAIAVLMPPSGALVSLALLTIFLLRLILSEEVFLNLELGAPYEAYSRTVPRLIPRLLSRVVASGRSPQWGRAVLGELMPIGVLAGFAALSWQYNAQLLTRTILIAFGVSLVVRALLSPEAG